MKGLILKILNTNNLIYAVDIPKTYSFITLGMLRKLIFHAEYNGFNKVIVRIGRRVLIDIDAFFEWLKEKNPDWAINEVQSNIKEIT